MNYPLSRKEQQILAHYYRTYRNDPNFSGISIGLKEVGGTRTTNIVPCLHVKQKISEKEFTFDSEIAMVQDKFGESRTKLFKDGDVIEADYANTPQSSMGDFTPIPSLRKVSEVMYPGLGIGPERKVHAGTLGAIVFERNTGKPGILTNYHVISPNEIGQSVMQPGGLDAVNSGRKVATLTKHYLGIGGDFAFCALTGEHSFSTFVNLDPNADVIIPTWVQIYRKGYEFLYEKVGMTTGHTVQICNQIGIFRIGYGGAMDNVDMHGFQLIPRNEQSEENNVEGSSAGDSGSGIYVVKERGSNRQVQQAGILVGGESSGIPTEERTICCHAWNAANLMNVVWNTNQL